MSLKPEDTENTPIDIVPDEAPEGCIWVCGACGKTAKSRLEVGDESCYLNAVLCYTKKNTLGNWQAVEKKVN